MTSKGENNQWHDSCQCLGDICHCHDTLCSLGDVKVYYDDIRHSDCGVHHHNMEIIGEHEDNYHKVVDSHHFVEDNHHFVEDNHHFVEDNHHFVKDNHPCNCNKLSHRVESRPIFGKYILLMCGTITFGLSISLPISLSIMFLEWQDAFVVTRAHTAAVHSTCIGIIFSGGVVAGFLVDKFGARTICLVGSFLASLGLVLGFFATSINYLIATTGVMAGSGFCLLQLPCMPCIAKPFTKYKSLTISICSFGAAAMNMVFPHVYRLLVEYYSWRGAYLIISGLALNTAFTSLLMTSTVWHTASAETPFEEHLLGVKQHRDSTLAQECDLSLTMPSTESALPSDCKHDEEVADHNKICYELNSSQSTGVKAKSSSESNKGVGMKWSVFTVKLRNYFKSSDWNFIRNPMFLFYLLCLGITLGSLFACFVLLMDVAKVKHFDQSTGALFILTASVANIGGRLIVCGLNLSERIHSFTIMCVFGGVASLAMIVLGFVTEFISILTCIVIIGVGIGATVSIYPKCALDMTTASSGSYPLALGVTCTAEGIFDFLIPIAIGFMVDVSNDYILPLTVLGSISILMTSTLMLLLYVQRWRKRKEGKIKLGRKGTLSSHVGSMFGTVKQSTQASMATAYKGIVWSTLLSQARCFTTSCHVGMMWSCIKYQSDTKGNLSCPGLSQRDDMVPCANNEDLDIAEQIYN